MSGWKQRVVGAVVLSVLAGLPVLGTVCAELCDPAVNSASSYHAEVATHYGSKAACHEPRDSAGVRAGATSGHDCVPHDGTVRGANRTLTTGRADTSVLPAAAAPAFVAFVQAALSPFISVGTRSGYNPPPGASPTGAPRVLRI